MQDDMSGIQKRSEGYRFTVRLKDGVAKLGVFARQVSFPNRDMDRISYLFRFQHGGEFFHPKVKIIPTGPVKHQLNIFSPIGHELLNILFYIAADKA